MDHFTVELRHGENRQVWIACCEMEEEALNLVQEASGALPNARAESEIIAGEPPFCLKPNTVRQWV